MNNVYLPHSQVCDYAHNTLLQVFYILDTQSKYHYEKIDYHQLLTNLIKTLKLNNKYISFDESIYNDLKLIDIYLNKLFTFDYSSQKTKKLEYMLLKNKVDELLNCFEKYI